jgi:hypothetical protein
MQQLAQSAKERLETSCALIQERATSAGVDVEPGRNGRMSEDFDPEYFSLGSNFNLDDLFFLPADFDMNGVAGPP